MHTKQRDDAREAEPRMKEKGSSSNKAKGIGSCKKKKDEKKKQEVKARTHAAAAMRKKRHCERRTKKNTLRSWCYESQ